MKKILMISGLIVLALFLVACARQGGESAFAGQAVGRGDVKIQSEKRIPKEKITAKQLLGESKAEICDNNVDDNGDGKIDCADPKCAGTLVQNNNHQETVCTKGKRFTCGLDFKSGNDIDQLSVLNIKELGFDVLCDLPVSFQGVDGKKYEEFRFTACNANGIKEGKDWQSDFHYTKYNPHNYAWLCTETTFGGKKYESWVKCGGKKAGTDGVDAKVGDIYNGFFCSSNHFWVKK